MSARVPAAHASSAHTGTQRADSAASAAALLGGSSGTSASTRGGTDSADTAADGGSPGGGTAFSSAMAAAAHPGQSQPDGAASGATSSSAVQGKAQPSASSVTAKTATAGEVADVDGALPSAAEMIADTSSAPGTDGPTRLPTTGSTRTSSSNTSAKTRSPSGGSDPGNMAGTFTSLQLLLGAASMGANSLSAANASGATAATGSDDSDDDAIDADAGGVVSASSGASAAAITAAYSGASAANAASSAAQASATQQSASLLANAATAAAGGTPTGSTGTAPTSTAGAAVPADAGTGNAHSSDDSSTAPDNTAAPDSLAWGLPSVFGTADSIDGAAASQLSAVPVGHEQWPQAVAAQVHMMAANGVQTATVRLSPQHLGPLEVRIELQHSQVNVSFSAHHAETRSALAEALPRLRDLLTSGGLNLGQTSVQQESRSHSGNDGASQGAAPDRETVESVAVSSSRALGLIDEYA